MPGQQTPIHAIERVEQFLLSLCLQFVTFPLQLKLVEKESLCLQPLHRVHFVICRTRESSKTYVYGVLQSRFRY